MAAYRRGHGNRGVAMMEMIMGLVIFAIAAVGIFAGFRAALGAWTTARQFTGEHHNARLVLDWAARRVRAAGSSYVGTPIAVAQGSEIVFYGDTNGNGRVECHRIYYNGVEKTAYINTTEANGPPPALPAACEAGTGEPLTTQVEVKGLEVVGLFLRYFDGGPGAGTELLPLPLTDPLDRARVRRVEISIRTRGLQSPDYFSMSTQVLIR